MNSTAPFEWVPFGCPLKIPFLSDSSSEWDSSTTPGRSIAASLERLSLLCGTGSPILEVEAEVPVADGEESCGPSGMDWDNGDCPLKSYDLLRNSRYWPEGEEGDRLAISAPSKTSASPRATFASSFPQNTRSVAIRLLLQKHRSM